jgi:transposase-like protein
MTKDPSKHSEYEDPIDAEMSYEADDEVADVEAPVVVEKPTCPRCGWHNTRPSYSKNVLDKALRMFSLRAYRCRSCGNRFRVFRRVRS